MNESNTPITSNYFLKPGYIFLAPRPTMISTVLGTCVSVCLFDKKKNRGGMNRFLYPFIKDKKKATSEYGNVAIYALIRMLFKDGSEKKHLEAQILGGAFNPNADEINIGNDNVEIARKILRFEGICIKSEDTGGEKGRKVVFNSGTNELAVFKVERLRKSDWYPYHGER